MSRLGDLFKAMETLQKEGLSNYSITFLRQHVLFILTYSFMVPK